MVKKTFETVCELGGNKTSRLLLIGLIPKTWIVLSS